MGVVEAVILAIYALASTGFNVYQSNVNGSLEAENKQLKVIAEECIPNPIEHKRAVDAADVRAKREERIREITEKSEATTIIAVEGSGIACLATPLGSLGSLLRDDAIQLVEELRRLQSKP